MTTILIVEDHKKLRAGLERGLREEGFAVTAASNGEDGYYLATTEDIDLVILDVLLPKRDGFQVLRDLRKHDFGKPVLLLTARDAVEDRVTGLDAGADDYLVKPFAFEELLARVRALLRRATDRKVMTFRAADLELNLLARRVLRGREEIELTRREFDLLEYLLRHKNSVVTRDMIGRDVWKEPAANLTNVIDVYVGTLRKKIERTDAPLLIHTIRGVGYSVRDDS